MAVHKINDRFMSKFTPLVHSSDGNYASCLFCDILQIYFFSPLRFFTKGNLIKKYFSEINFLTRIEKYIDNNFELCWGHQSEVSIYLSC